MTEAQRWTIVNVKDPSTVYAASAQLLRAAGYRVIEASTNQEACSLAKQERSTLLLLREQETEEFRVLADQAPALLWVNGSDGCEFVNRAYVDFLGVRGFDWAQYVHPDDRKGYVTAYLEAVIARRLFEATFRFRRHDGEYRWMKSIGMPRFDADGTFLGYIGSTIDVTDLQARALNSLPTVGTESDQKGKLHRRFRTVSAWLASATACIASLVLVGWGFGLTQLTSLSSQFQPMKVTTAVGFLCAAWSILLLRVNRHTSPQGGIKTLGIISTVLASVAVFLGLGTLVGYALGWQGDAAHPGWMAMATAASFVLLGLALISYHRAGRVSERISDVLILLVLFITGVALLGYLYAKDSLYAVGPYSSMTLHTALSFVFLGAASLCARPERGLMAMLSSGEPGAVMMRRMLPLTLGLLVISGWIRLVGEHNGWFDQYFGLTLLVGLNVMGLGIILWIVARSLNRIDAARSESREALRQSQSRLNNILESMTDGFQIIDRDWRFTYMNDAAKRMLREQGRDPDALIGQMVFDEAFPDAKNSPVYRSLHRVMNERVPVDFENLYEPWNRWHHVRAYPIQDAGIAVFFQDITERMQAQAALGESEERLRLLAETADLLLRSGSPQAVVEVLCRKVMVFLDCQVFFNYLLEPSGERLHLNASAGIPDEDARRIEWLEVGAAVCGCVARDKKRIVAERIGESDDERTELVRSYGVQAYACHPLAAQDQLIGTLSFGTRTRTSFSAEDLSLMKAVTDQVAIAMQRKQDESALCESEARLQAIMDRAPAAIFMKDRDGRSLFMNEECARVLGLDRTRVQGKTEYELYPMQLAEQFRANDRVVWDSGESHMLEEHVPQSDGLHTFLSNKFLLRDADGRPYALCGIASDITSRRRMEETLREQQQLLKSVTDNADVGLFIMDERQHCVFMNPAAEQLTGFTLDEVRARPLHEYVHHTRPNGKPYPLSECPIDQAFPEDNRMQGEEVFVHKDGRFYYVAFTASPLRNQTGVPVGTIIEVQDITERKRSEDALVEAQARLQRWNVELEQAVNIKTAELQQSRERLRALTSELNLAEQRERKRLATELHDHLQQILVYGKMTIGQGKRRIADVPAAVEVITKVDQVLSEALTYSRTLVAELSPPVLRDHGLAAGLNWLGEYMKKHETTVTVTVPEQEPILPEDQVVLLFQSVRELLINSAKHAETGEATVCMEQHEDNLSITVSDHGKGFDLAAAAAAETPSSGISSKFGLLSIQERMRALGGSFLIESAPGQGTSATLVLPWTAKAKDNASTPEISPASRASDVPARTIVKKPSPRTIAQAVVQVLLVDDHAMVRQGLRSVLDAYDDLQVVAEAGDGTEAVRLVGELHPRVVVMDINMPGMNGIDATTHIKTHWPETTVIGISVNAGDHNGDAMKRAGAATVLSKDTAVDHLHDAIVQEVGLSPNKVTSHQEAEQVRQRHSRPVT